MDKIVAYDIEIPEEVAVMIRGALAGTIMKYFFDAGGVMDRKDGFLISEKLNDCQRQICAMSLYVLREERGGGETLLANLMKRFMDEKLDCKGKLIRSN